MKRLSVPVPWTADTTKVTADSTIYTADGGAYIPPQPPAVKIGFKSSPFKGNPRVRTRR